MGERIGQLAYGRDDLIRFAARERRVAAGHDVAPERGDNAVDRVLGDLESGEGAGLGDDVQGRDGRPWRDSERAGPSGASTSSPDSISGLVSRVRLPADRSRRRASSLRDNGPRVSTSNATARSPELSGTQVSAFAFIANPSPRSFCYKRNDVTLSRSNPFQVVAARILTARKFCRESNQAEDEVESQTRESR